MNKINILKFILSLLEEDSKIPKKYKEKINSFEYLHSGQIDSLKLIHFIFKLEKKYKLKFSISEKESMNFRTVGGLVNLIIKKN